MPGEAEAELLNRMNWFRRLVAILLGLAVLALPGAPSRYASAGPMEQHPARQACLLQDHAELSEVPMMHDGHHQARDPCGGADDAMPGLNCCAAAQCPATTAVPPPSLAGPQPIAVGCVTRLVATTYQLDGIELRPALPPPRAQA